MSIKKIKILDIRMSQHLKNRKKKKEKYEKETIKTEKEYECYIWWTKYVCTSDNPTSE